MNAYDIETYIDAKDYHIPYCICLIFKKKKKHFYKNNVNNIIIQSIEYLLNNTSKKNTIYVHNLNFDGIFLLIELTKNKTFKFDVFMRNYDIYSIKIYYNFKTIEFKCSFKLLPLSLNKLSDIFDTSDKLIFPHKFAKFNTLNYIGNPPEEHFFESYEDYKKFKNNITIFDFKKYAIEYCYMDTTIVSTIISNLKNILKNLKINIESIYSASSLSLKIFEKKFNNNKIKLKISKLEDKIVRSSYFGGKCEVYGNPYDHEMIFHFDFSGMYAQCMQQKFPFGKHKFLLNPTSLDKPGFYWITGTINSNLPPLPHHNKINKKLMFTNGDIDDCYWFEEIIEALNNGLIIHKIRHAIIYENFDFVFTDFIEYFNNIKKKGNDYKFFAKLIINSLYGRLGMNYIDTHTSFIEKNDLNTYLKKTNVIDFKEINEYILIRNEIDFKLKKINNNVNIKKIKSNISIASAITSKARIKLLKAQNEVIKNNGRLLYSDTDSIFAAFNENVSNKKHGEVFWDSNKNDTIIKKALFIKPKMYGIVYLDNREIIKIKGFNQKNITFEEFKNTFENEEFMILKNFKFINRKEILNKNETSTKTYFIKDYNKRKFIDNYKKTIPYTYKNSIYT